MFEAGLTRDSFSSAKLRALGGTERLSAHSHEQCSCIVAHKEAAFPTMSIVYLGSRTAPIGAFLTSHERARARIPHTPSILNAHQPPPYHTHTRARSHTHTFNAHRHGSMMVLNFLFKLLLLGALVRVVLPLLQRRGLLRSAWLLLAPAMLVSRA